MSQKNRSTLKGFFIKGVMPTEENIEDFIDSSINKQDDLITISEQPDDTIYLGIGVDDPGSPVSIQADKSDERLVSFEETLEPVETWFINQNPGGKLGLNIGESNKTENRLFIQTKTGHIGIGATEPKTILEVNGALASKYESNGNGTLYLGRRNEEPGATIQYLAEENRLVLRVTTSKNENLVIQDSGSVGIGHSHPESQLHVNGPLKLKNGNTITDFSTDKSLAHNSEQKIPTQKAIKAYLKKSRFHLNTWWSERNQQRSTRISSTSKYTSWKNMDDLTQTIYTTGHPVLISFKASDVQTYGIWRTHAEFRILLNGVEQASCRHDFYRSYWLRRDVSLMRLLNIPAGTHTVKVQWSIRSPYARARYWQTSGRWVTTRWWHRTRRRHWFHYHDTSHWHYRTRWKDTSHWVSEIRAHLVAGWNGGNRSLTAIEL